MFKYFLSKFNNQVLLYHSTFSNEPSELKNQIHNVRPETIYKQIIWLKKRYDIIDLDDFVSKKNNRGKASITFDDAYISVYNETIPILKDLKVPFTIFVNGVTLENKPMWRDKIRYIMNNKLIDELLLFEKPFFLKNNINKDNFYRSTKRKKINSKYIDDILDSFFSKKRINTDEILFCYNNLNYFEKNPLITYGNHSYNHYLLSSLSIKELEYEVFRNHQLLEKMNLKKSKIFSIPFGGENDFNNDLLVILKKLKYKGFLLSNNKLNNSLLSKKNDLLEINRYMVEPDYRSFKRQTLKLSVKNFFYDY